ncbi:MAG: radical SAM family heme chaperone HemW [Candidatus Dadabacteria bacterium]|nr:MAG: radical SAM family heme chaperone HemW [Candidatus Dadabacteria bacterium]
MKSFALYVHIPYCLHKCPYCDFNTYAVSAIPEDDYVAALLSEIDYRASLEEWHGREVSSIYFGGGTPSLFSPGSIRKILAVASRLFPISNRVEITLEANPGTVDADMLYGYREAGVNRLSLGIQSFQPETLHTLGRIHTPQQSEAAYLTARSAGFKNISLDLMYGVPGQTIDLLSSDLWAIAALAPEHVSPYGLTIEKGTPFYQAYKKKTLLLPDEDLVLEMMQLINQGLTERGYIHYEISNYARPGREARHNMAYWDGIDYLGLGAGAHSFVCSWQGKLKTSGRRWANYALPGKYIKEAAAHGKAEAWSDRLNKKDLIIEFFFLGLRKIKGVSKSEFEKFFGLKVNEVYPLLLTVLEEQELIKLDGDNIFLSEKGLRLADSVIENFTEPSLKVVKMPEMQNNALKGENIPQKQLGVSNG